MLYILPTDEKLIATKFNTYFIDSVNDIIKNVQTQSFDLKVIDDNVSVQPPFTLDKFRVISMKKQVKTMKNVGGGENGVSTRIFKDIFSAVGNRVLDIINTSLANDVFPGELEMFCRFFGILWRLPVFYHFRIIDIAIPRPSLPVIYGRMTTGHFVLPSPIQITEKKK